jgi:hypothetical protein
MQSATPPGRGCRQPIDGKQVKRNDTHYLALLTKFQK